MLHDHCSDDNDALDDVADDAGDYHDDHGVG